MSPLQLAGYVADVFILASYLYLAKTTNARPYHWVNAITAFPLLALEIQAGLWQLVLLTGFYGVIAWYGLWQEHRAPTKEHT